MSRRAKWIAAAVVLIVAGIVFTQTSWYARLMIRIEGKKTLAQRISQYGPAARDRLVPLLQSRHIPYPPSEVILVGLKRERKMLLYARAAGGPTRYVATYPILGASGKLGPKLREGDMQVPEGIYRVVFLNPNSLYHLALRLDYPNMLDLEMAARDHRRHLGGDIMIHGCRCSVGCLAMGDPASEDLFVLAADAGIENVKVILSPVDFRTASCATDGMPSWTRGLYRQIAAELIKLPAPRESFPSNP